MSPFGVLLGAIVAGLTQTPLLFPLVVGIAMAVGYGWRTSHCSDPDCGHPLSLTAERCDGCGGFVAGEIDHEKKRLDALEAYEDAQEP